MMHTTPGNYLTQKHNNRGLNYGKQMLRRPRDNTALFQPYNRQGVRYAQGDEKPRFDV